MGVLLLVIDFLGHVVLFVPFFHGSILWGVFERFQLLTSQCIIFLRSWFFLPTSFLSFTLKSDIAPSKFQPGLAGGSGINNNRILKPSRIFCLIS